MTSSIIKSMTLTVSVFALLGPATAALAPTPIQLFASGGAYITKSNDKPAGEAHVVDNTNNGGANDDFAVYDFATHSQLLPTGRVASTIAVSLEADLHGKYEHAGTLDFYIGTQTTSPIGNADTGDHAWDSSPSGAKDNPIQVLPVEGIGLGSGLGIGSYFGTPDKFYPLGQAQWSSTTPLQQFQFSIPYAAQAYIDKQLSGKGDIRIFISDDSHHAAGGDAEVTITPPWITITTVPVAK